MPNIIIKGSVIDSLRVLIIYQIGLLLVRVETSVGRVYGLKGKNQSFRVNFL